MLESARKLALIYLWNQFNGRSASPTDLSGWFVGERAENPQKFFPYLIEDTGKVEMVYVLTPSHLDCETVILEGVSIDQFMPRPSEKLPFNMPSGSQSAALGPLLKRSYSKEKGPGPSSKIVKTTLEGFEKKGREDSPWASYFKEISQILDRKKLQFCDQVYESTAEDTVLHLAIKHIKDSKPVPVFLTVKDFKGRYPGEVPEYCAYLQEILPESKYASLATPKQAHQDCPLCFAHDVTLYPSACSGAGLNIGNVDRDGAFPGIDKANAYLGYALCLDCADLLYIFKNYVMKDLLTFVAGSRALILPNLFALDDSKLGRVANMFEKYSDAIEKGSDNVVRDREIGFKKVLQEKSVITTIDVIWADFGQKMEGVRGIVTDILPSNLEKLLLLNELFNDSDKARSPFYPRYWDSTCSFDLSLYVVQALLKRPGGKAAEKANLAAPFWDFKSHLVSCLYHGVNINGAPLQMFWSQIWETMQWHLNVALKDDYPQLYLTKEGFSEKKNKTWLTGAGWMRHFSVFLDYLRKAEVLDMQQNVLTYVPEWEKLRPYFSSDSAIDTDVKALAFLLGIYYGLLLRVQALRGVNVAANALTWVQKPSFSSKDLFQVFENSWGKIQQYLAAGEFNKKENKNKKAPLENLFREIGKVGLKIKEKELVSFSRVFSRYYLLLGMAMVDDILYKQEEK